MQYYHKFAFQKKLQYEKITVGSYPRFPVLS